MDNVREVFSMDQMHNIVLENRERLSVSAVSEVISFNESEVNLLINECALVIKGVNLKVEEVNKQSGDVVIEGESIDSIVYSKHTKRGKEGIIRRILK